MNPHSSFSFDKKSGPQVRYKAVAEHLGCNLNGEEVILSLKNGTYYGLNPVASLIWKLLQNPVTLFEIESAIMLEYDVSREQCGNETTLFLAKMCSEGLVETIYEPIYEVA